MYALVTGFSVYFFKTSTPSLSLSFQGWFPTFSSNRLIKSFQVKWVSSVHVGSCQTISSLSFSWCSSQFRYPKSKTFSLPLSLLLSSNKHNQVSLFCIFLWFLHPCLSVPRSFRSQKQESLSFRLFSSSWTRSKLLHNKQTLFSLISVVLTHILYIQFFSLFLDSLAIPRSFLRRWFRVCHLFSFWCLQALVNLPSKSIKIWKTSSNLA